MRSSRWTYLIAIVALAGIAVAALSLEEAGSGEAEPTDPPSSPPVADAAEPAARTPVPAASRHRLKLDAPKRAYPIVWLRPGERLAVRTHPGAGKIAEVLERKTEFGSPTVLGVVRTHKRWAAVSVPSLANDRLGWIRLDSRRLRSGWVRESIVVDLSEHRAVLRKGGKRVRSFAVTVGAPGSETPSGRFAVTDTFRGGLNPAYGCCALALSAIQPNLPSGWLGGNRIAIHGNGVGGPLGAEISSGCVRAADDDVDALVDAVPLGTPVFIRS